MNELKIVTCIFGGKNRNRTFKIQNRTLAEVMKVLSITASPASALIKRMLEMKLIHPFKGKGKGKYLFQREKVLGSTGLRI